MTEIIAECLPDRDSGDPVGAELRRRRGARTADRGDAGRARTRPVAQMLAHSIGSATFRPYHSTDVRGVEIGGAAKNVLAIAAGIVAGRGLGASAAAALTTRGFAELVRFGRAYGAQVETLTGLSGLGDLILTCSSPQSRNFSLGRGARRRRKLRTRRARRPARRRRIHGLGADRNGDGPRKIEMPVAAAVAAVLDGKLGIDAAIEALLTRPLRAEG